MAMKHLLSNTFKIWDAIFSIMIIVIKSLFPIPCFSNLWESGSSQQLVCLEWKSGVWDLLLVSLYSILWRHTLGATLWLHSQFFIFFNTELWSANILLIAVISDSGSKQVAWHLGATSIICIATYFWATLMGNSPQNWSWCSFPIYFVIHKGTC